MHTYYLAVDIGASSGRHILGHLENGRMVLEEIYRFENGMANQDGKKLWEVDRIFTEIVNGMKRCKELNQIPVSMSIDTWAVDYVLLDEKDQILGDTYGYRDSRTTGMDEKVYERIPEADLYHKTGIQKQIFNTIYQLMAVKQSTPELLGKAKTFLMLPDYFQFLLTGNKVSEYTNGTSTQLVSPLLNQWDEALLDRLGYPKEMFLPLSLPGTVVGNLTEEMQKEVGYDLTVVLCASHDTASAVMAMPKEEGTGLYISSGTWSLMGTEVVDAICTEDSRKANFTNEGGYDYRFRYLKNIMGLWMIQSVRHELEDAYSFAELCEMAEACKEFPSRVDVNDDVFLAPDSMIQAIKDYCVDTDQQVPESVGELASVIYQSLAECYGRTVREIEENTHQEYDCIHIIGGGSNASYLNQLTANATRKKVLAGPGEATAIGNMMAQMIRSGELQSLSEARRCVLESFDIKEYKPI
ncbi:rhamnulokinase [Bariatricus sp. SGI.154]|uniref:rhamnulokinase n=1 Tax=Bariatricus sp. SGI.154 TaxID=3420549 RepID=UPI003CFDD479